MTTCEALAEQMPAVARGEARWDPAALDHLASCPACAAEWRVVVAAVELGRATPAIDAERVGRVVLRRLASAGDRSHRIRRRLGAVAGIAAAAIALLLWSPRRPAPGGPDAPVAPIFLPELDSLTAVQLESVLGAVDPPFGAVRTFDAPDLNGLSNDQLSDVLHALEG